MKVTRVILALVSVVGLATFLPRILTARASSNPGIQSASKTSCVDRYNALVRGAKSALTKGDRAATVDLLEQAERIIPSCQPLQDGTSPRAALDI
jgi:hypothetical protein